MFKIQFDYHGRLRILAPDGTMGEWAHYRGIAQLTYQGKTYIAATEYGLLPQAEKVYELGAIQPSSTDSSMEYIDAQGVDHNATV